MVDNIKIIEELVNRYYINIRSYLNSTNNVEYDEEFMCLVENIVHKCATTYPISVPIDRDKYRRQLMVLRNCLPNSFMKGIRELAERYIK